MCERNLKEIIHIIERDGSGADWEAQMLSLKERFPERDVFAALAWLFLNGLFGRRIQVSRRIISLEERSAMHVDALGYLYSLYEFGTLNDTVFDQLLLSVRAIAQVKQEKVALSEIKQMVQKHLFYDYLELQPRSKEKDWYMDDVEIFSEHDIKVN